MPNTRGKQLEQSTGSRGGERERERVADCSKSSSDQDASDQDASDDDGGGHAPEASGEADFGDVDQACAASTSVAPPKTVKRTLHQCNMAELKALLTLQKVDFSNVTFRKDFISLCQTHKIRATLRRISPMMFGNSFRRQVVVVFENPKYKMKFVSCDFPPPDSGEVLTETTQSDVGTFCLTLQDFQEQYMHIGTRRLPHGNNCILGAAHYRGQCQTLHSEEKKNAYSDNTLKQYVPRIAEFLEFVCRRYPAGPSFPLCTVEHIDTFFQFFINRGKFRSSVIHAHNRTSTASMLGEYIKAINKLAKWERSDPGWLRIVNNDFPVDFAWLIGWLPLKGKYAPASGETTQGPINYLRRKQGEEVNASHLPHPDMLMVMTSVSREDFHTILDKHMNRNETEMAAFETLANQSVQRAFCLQQSRLTDVTVLEIQQDRDLGETQVRAIQVLHLLLRDGKGNFGGNKKTGIIRHSITWKCACMHTAWNLFKRYVWSHEKGGPMFPVEFSKAISGESGYWTRHRLMTDTVSDPNIPVSSKTITVHLSQGLEELGWDPVFIEIAKKNQSHRKDGVNIMTLNGVQDSEMDNQGGWTGQHTSSKTTKSVRQSNYMTVESNISGMKTAADYQRDEHPNAGGRENIRYDTVQGVFFGKILAQLDTNLDTYRQCSSVTHVLPHVDKKETENIHARTISAVLQLKSVFAFCDKVSVIQVLCQDAPILCRFYPALSRFVCPLFSEDQWLTHETSAFQTWTHHKETSNGNVVTTSHGGMTTSTSQDPGPQHHIMSEDALVAAARDSVRAVLPVMVPEFLQRAQFASVPAGFSICCHAGFTGWGVASGPAPAALMMSPAPWGASQMMSRGVSQQMRPGGWGASLSVWDVSHPTPVWSHALGSPHQSCGVTVGRMSCTGASGGVHWPAPSVIHPPAQLLPEVPHAYPTISGIRQIQKGSAPFKVFLHFWIAGCVTSAKNGDWWHCTFADMQTKHGRGVRFWANGSGGDADLDQQHSKAKTCLDIICSSSRVSSTMTVDSMVKQLLSGNTTTLITETDYSALYDAADDLDVLFVKQDSQWDVFVQTQRDTLVHRPKRRKRD